MPKPPVVRGSEADLLTRYRNAIDELTVEFPDQPELAVTFIKNHIASLSMECKARRTEILRAESNAAEWREWAQALAADFRAYRRMVGWLLRHRADHPGEDIDGGDLQAALVDSGLIEEYRATEPCCESCICGELGFPTDCARLTDLGRAALAEPEVSA